MSVKKRQQGISAASSAGSVADPNALQTLYDKACDELEALEPDLERAEQSLQALQQEYNQLKQQRQRLLTLKLSLQPMLQHPSLVTSGTGNEKTEENLERLPEAWAITESMVKPVIASPQTNASLSAPFSADVAFHEINQRLRQRDSVNYEIFRAIVYAGGQATTEQIKHYLIEQDIRQPANGEAFTDVSLADISARANYLVKKGLVTIESRGVLRSVFGWLS